MTEPYDLRSNIKGKPGSQGTLFQVKDKGLLNPQQRWPKGYSPDRLNEVRGALSKTSMYADPESVGVEEEDHAGRTRVEREHRPRVEQALARSTVPAEHLHDLDTLHNEVNEGTSGTYWPRPKITGETTLAVDMSGYHEGSREAEKTLLHEVGHHVDYEHSLDRHRLVPQVAESHAWKDKGPYQDKPNASGKAQAYSKVQAGVMEATADNYMTQHYRTHGRNPKPETTGRYEENFTPEQREKQYPGYNDVRAPKNLSSQQFQGLF
jgi:hypothetical protein